MPSTLAVFVSVPGKDGVITVIARSTVSNLATGPTTQVTVPDACAQPALASSKVTPPGRVSVTVTPVASSGPRFETCSV